MRGEEKGVGGRGKRKREILFIRVKYKGAIPPSPPATTTFAQNVRESQGRQQKKISYLELLLHLRQLLLQHLLLPLLRLRQPGAAASSSSGGRGLRENKI